MPREVDEEGLRAAVKREIRQRHRALRRAMPREARQRRSEAIARRVAELAEWPGARTLLAFVSMPTEVQTASLVERARREGKRVAAPRLNASRDDLTLHLWSAEEELEESGMRFRQPPADAAPVDEASVDLVLVPALAADERGHRVGFGAGFYDRLLPRLPGALRVALLFDFERVPEVPARSLDVPVDVIVTDARVIRTGARERTSPAVADPLR